MSTPSVTTRTATLAFVAPDIHVIRYNAGIIVDTAAIRENGEAIVVLPRARATIVVVPEGTGFAMDMLEQDHAKGTDEASLLEILAMVVEDPIFIHAAQLYFAYHPPAYRFRIFTELGPAEIWVRDELADPGK